MNIRHSEIDELNRIYTIYEKCEDLFDICSEDLDKYAVFSVKCR